MDLQLLPREEFNELREMADKMESYLRRPVIDPIEMQSVVEICGFIEEIRRKSPLLQSLLDHDGYKQDVAKLMMSTSAIADGGVSQKGDEDVSEYIEAARRNVIVCVDAIHGLEPWTAEAVVSPSFHPLHDFLNDRRYGWEGDFRGNLHIEEGLDGVALLHRGIFAGLLSNMARNARKHGNAKNLLIKTEPDDKSVIISVNDDGVGIPEEIYPRIYDFGFSGSGSTGLGLAHAPDHVAKMNGVLRSQPRGGRLGGAYFEIQLQAA